LRRLLLRRGLRRLLLPGRLCRSRGARGERLRGATGRGSTGRGSLPKWLRRRRRLLRLLPLRQIPDAARERVVRSRRAAQ